MRVVVRALLLTTLLLSGHDTLATPRSDASYIAQRNLDAEAVGALRRYLKRSFVPVYFRPISGLGIKIVDHDGFADLIPDKDVEPFIHRFTSELRDNYISIYTPKQLVSLAALLRADEDASVQEIFSKEYRRKQAAALEQARARAKSSGSDEPLVLALEEFMVQLDAFISSFGENGAEEFAQDIALSIAPIFILARYGHEIARLERGLDNPVIIAVLKADGVLKFANPVQRQTLLRKLSTSEKADGIRFSRPPARTAGSN